MKKTLLILTILGAGILGCAQNSEPDFILEGRIAMKGASPHNYLVIEDAKSHKSYKIKNLESFDLSKRQNQKLKLKAILLKEAIGPGFPAVVKVTEVLDQ